MRLAVSAVLAVLVLPVSADAASLRRADDPAARPPAVTTVTAAPAPEPATDTAYADPSRALGATSPSCRYGLSAELRRSCRASGSPAQPHPLSSYGIDVRAGFSLTDPGKTFMSALQSIGAGVWMALLYAVKGVLLLLEWAFSLDLTVEAMPDASRTLARLHSQVFGEPWLMLAISVTGLWGIWRGLVQRRAAETFAGLAATTAMFVVALVIIARPGPTVGEAARLVNGVGMEVLAAGTGQRGGDPRSALGTTLAGVFDQTVRDPWCALQFGSVDYCDSRKGGGPRTADLWLAYPAQSWQRDRLHTAMKPKDDDGFSLLGTAKDVLGLSDDRKLPDDVRDQVVLAPERAKMQEAGGTFPRLALLASVAVGLLGALALLAYVGVRLLLAAAMTVLLLLLAPAMLIAPAFGDPGRAAFLAWARRLIGAIAAKLIFSIFLTVVLATGRVFTHLEIGWFGTWLLLGAFWWGVFLKRNEVLEFVAAGTPRAVGGGAGQALSQGYYAWMLGRGARQLATAAASPATAAARGVADHRANRRLAMALAGEELARERLDTQARQTLIADEAHARGELQTAALMKDELRAVNYRLRGFDEKAAVARATGGAPPVPTTEQRALLSHRAQLQHLTESPRAAAAEEIVRRADRNRASIGDPVSQRDLDVHRARRRRELDSVSDPTAEEHLRAAGIEPNGFQVADRDRREAFVRQVEEHVAVERRLHRAADGEGQPGRDDVDRAELARRAEEHRRRLRQERRARRVRAGGGGR